MSPKLSDFRKGDLGQLYTLEGAATAILMIFLIVFVVKASPLTPLTSSSSHQQVEAQLETRGLDLLIVLDYIPEGETYSPLKQAMIDWTGVEFNGQSSTYPNSVNELAETFNLVFLRDGTAYNLEVAFLNEDDEWETMRMFWNGQPSDNSVLVTRKIALHDSDDIQASFIPDRSDDSDFYNIIDVQLTLWRM